MKNSINPQELYLSFCHYYYYFPVHPSILHETVNPQPLLPVHCGHGRGRGAEIAVGQLHNENIYEYTVHIHLPEE